MTKKLNNDLIVQIIWDQPSEVLRAKNSKGLRSVVSQLM